MRFELGLEEPDPKRASQSAFTIAVSYIAGGLVPLAPYFFCRSVHSALIGSVVLTLLGAFGVRLHQGAIHHGPALPQCVANRHRGRVGGDGGFRDCEGTWVVSLLYATFIMSCA